MARESIHPGEHLAEELEARSMSAAALGRQIAMPTTRIVDILAGRSAITDDIALRLAHLFGTSAQFWMNLQNLYDLNQSRSKSGGGRPY
jgi:addiction module HigA family antidote